MIEIKLKIKEDHAFLISKNTEVVKMNVNVKEK